MIFKLKQFSIQQSPDVFKVGTDAVVLGALLQNQGPRILEIGTGTGIIALMLAQRFQQAHITAIDINAQAVALAKNNFKNSKKPSFYKI